MRTNHPAVRLVALGATTFITVTGCAGGTASPTTSATGATASALTSTLAPLNPTSITLWNLPFPAREEIDKAVIAEFEAANPGVDVTYEIGPGDDLQYITKVVTALAGGGGPDCFNVWTLGVGTLAREGGLEPVDPAAYGAADVAELESRYLEGTLGGYKYNGELLAVPTEVSIYGMFQNTAVFEAAGLDPVADAPMTWEDLATLAPKLNQSSGGTLTRRAFDFQYGQPDDPTSAALTLGGMAYQLGGNVVNEAGTAGALDSDAWVKVFTFIKDWVANKNGDPSLTSAFVGYQDGSVAMTVSGSWYTGVLKDAGSAALDTSQVIPLPRFADAVNNTAALAYGYGIFVNAKAGDDQKAACQRLATALASRPAEYLEKTGLLQPTNELLASDAVAAVPNLDVFIEDLKGTPFFPLQPRAIEMLDVVTRALQRVVTNGEDAKASLDAANDEITELLAAQ